MGPDQHLRERVRRADSWIKASARLESGQLHETFVFLYIAFNCLYGRRPYEGDETRIAEDLEAFFEKILELAAHDRKEGGEVLQQAIKVSSKDAALLIRDRFLDTRYWNRTLPVDRLHEALKSDAKTALDQAAAGEYGHFLSVTFRRISVLRNQILHGCATYGAATAGRSSLAVAVRLMKMMIPAFHLLIRSHGQHAAWDPVPYPRLGSAQRR